MRLPILLTLAAAGFLTGCHRSVAPKAPVAEVAAAPHAPAAIIPTELLTTTPEFVARVAEGDRFAVDAGRIALARSTNGDVREFAAEMISAGGETADALAHALADARIHSPLPAAPSPALQARLAALASASPTQFDRAYIQSQIEAHEGGVALLQGYARRGDVSQLQRFAADSAPALREHIGVARSILATFK